MAPPMPSRIRSQVELETMWRALMEPLGFSRTSLWLTALEGDLPTKVMVEIGDLPPKPDADSLAGFRGILVEAFGDASEARLAMLLSRPGGGGLTAGDRAWARGVLAAARSAGVQAEPMHLATDHALRLISPDDLIGRGPAAVT
jgi:hypothetical protein